MYVISIAWTYTMPHPVLPSADRLRRIRMPVSSTRTADEVATIDQAAAIAATSRSEFLRRAALRAAEQALGRDAAGDDGITT